MMPDDSQSNQTSRVNGIPGVSMDDDGFIATIHGRCHPVTDEGLTFPVPDQLWNEIVRALVQDGEESGPAEPFDFDAWFAERFPTKGNDA